MLRMNVSKRESWLFIVSLTLLLGFVVSACVDTEADGETLTGCTEDSDCDADANEQCVDGYCQVVASTNCQFDSDCPTGQTCDLINQVCVESNVNCPIGRDCQMDIDCTTTNGLQGESWVCNNGCCEIPTSDDDDDDDDDNNDDDDDTSDDDDDNNDDDDDNGLPDDHCVNAGCDEYFTCNEESGDCEMGTTHCVNAGCIDHFVCDEVGGACNPGDDHCTNTGCDEFYQCLEEIGECKPADDHCTNAGCDDHYTCNAESGACEKAEDHCDNTPCATHFSCDHVSGDCEPDNTHCINQACELRHTCNQESGECEPGPDHCSTAGCLNGYECNETDGRCYPPAASQSACSGSCDGNSDQYCIDGGDFLCDCDDNFEVLDCETYCFNQGYPFFEGCGLYSPSEGTPYYRCDCENYGDSMGLCASPVEIEHFPYKHTWEIMNIMGIGATNNVSPNNCTPTGGVAADGYDRIYRFEAEGNEQYRIKVSTSLGDPWVTIRDNCGATFDWCMSASGTVLLAFREEMTVTIPETGDYFIAVEGNPGMMVIDYTLEVTKL